MKKIFIIVLLLVASFFTDSVVHAQDVCSDQDPCLNAADKVVCYQNVVDTCGKARDTLSSQITYLNSQIQLTTFQIQGIKKLIDTLTTEINQIAKEVDNLEQMLLKQTELLQKRVPESYKRHANSDTLETILFSTDIFDLIQKVQYIKKVQQEDWRLFAVYKKTQDNYNERKIKRETTKAKQEAAQRDYEQKNIQLAQQKQAKDSLLAQTKGQESLYQSLLADAKAKLAGFASFADSQGAGLLSNQTQCDDWGCYYNQRDSQWGNGLINGQGSGCVGSCTIARVGCLITSVAMVTSHLGKRDVLPSDIAFSSPFNFQVGTAMLKKGIIYVKGYSIKRDEIASKLSPDLLQSGPVVAGVYYGPFGTHFVVIKAYQDGKYIMYDPYESNGKNINFTDRYSLGSVFQVDRVSIN